ncbi:MAG: DUF2252 domain-containing protein [Cytophagales bacterium]|nr:DUF2252 domain-containing protein [Cytophagales bacterium]MDW8384788.1 DUF2252 family protein [Flammeovirgaceae bacterium]
MKILFKDSVNNRAHDVWEAIKLHHLQTDKNQKAKLQKMFASPYLFFRGTNHLFWYDFAGDWRLSKFGNERTITWLIGDAHIHNIGVFSNQKNEVVLGINDFDDAIPEDYQYDLWRFATSIVLAMQESNLDIRKAKSVVKRLAAGYLETIMRYEEQEPVSVFNEQRLKGALKKFIHRTKDTQGTAKMLSKYTVLTEKGRMFCESHTDFEHLSQEEENEFRQAFLSYVPYCSEGASSNILRLKDVVKRLNAGTGSLGLKRYFALIEVEEEQDVILDIKEIRAPTAFPHLSALRQLEYRQNFSHEGERFVTAAYSFVRCYDKYLGFIKISNDYFAVRSRCPFKKSFDTSKIKSIEKWEKTAAQWGKILANAHRNAAAHYNHAKTPFLFEQEISTLVVGREDDFAKLVSQTALSYADQVMRDWECFVKEFEFHYQKMFASNQSAEIENG